MLKNSIMYRKLWYIRHRNIRRLAKSRNSIRLAVFMRRLILMIFLLAIMFYTNKMLYPQMAIIGEVTARAEVTKQVAAVMNSVLTDGMVYDDIVVLKKASDGSISAIAVDSIILNKLCTSINIKLADVLSKLEKETIKIPVGSLLGNTIFAGTGPSILLKIKPIADINTSYESIFTEAGINQTKHSIILRIRVNILISAPLTKTNMTIENNVPLAETVIVGEVPNIMQGGIK